MITAPMVVLAVLILIATSLVSNSFGRASKQAEFELKPWLKCPHEFCEYHLPYRPLRDKVGDFVPETCGGCGGDVLYYSSGFSGYYLRFYRGAA